MGQPLPVLGNPSSLSLSALPLQLVDNVDKVYDAFETALREALQQGQTAPSPPDYLDRVAPAGRPILQRWMERLIQELRTPARLPFIPGYEMLTEIGRGGMGIVYKARKIDGNRLVAIKFVQAAELVRNQRLRILWEVEGEVVAGLHHPNIVPIEHFGESDGEHYLVMPLVAGGDLHAHIEEYGLAVPGLSPDERNQRQLQIAALLEKVARAIHHVHQRGVLHRDLKPKNILMDGANPLVCDFGLARRIDESLIVTRPGGIVGSWAYMAPEQLSNDGTGPHALTASDIWSLGAIIYELLSGHAPFLEDDPDLAELMQRKRSEPAPTAPSNLKDGIACDGDLEWICLQCLQRNVPDRFESAGALAEALQRYQQRLPVRPVETLRQKASRLLRPMWRPPVEPDMLDYQRKHLRIEACTSFAAQCGMFLLAQQQVVGGWLWLWFVLTDTALGWLVWAPVVRSRNRTKLGQTITQLWVAADLAALLFLAINCPWDSAVDAVMLGHFYSTYSVLRGLIFFVEGRICWGQLYLPAFAFYAGAIVMLWLPSYAPLIHASMYSGWFLWLSCQRWVRTTAETLTR